MKAKVLQILWHNKLPIFSLDIEPTFKANGCWVLATGGADKEIKFWEIRCEEDGNPCVSYLSSCSGISNTVNCVRFSPQGEMLASSGDNGDLWIWRLTGTHGEGASNPLGCDGPTPVPGAPIWKVSASLRGHRDDVMDVAWAPDASALVSGSVERSVLVWDVDARRPTTRFENHRHYVQGVCWDPLGQYLASQSADRSVQIYGHKPPPQGKRFSTLPSCAALAKELHRAAALKTRVLSTEAGTSEGPPQVLKAPLFHDESLTTFFRRPAWSPDGSFLVVPTGLFRLAPDAPEVHAAYVFARGEWSTPLLALPSSGKPIITVRFCPTLFIPTSASTASPWQEREQAPAGPASSPSSPATATEAPAASVFQLPYRCVFAVATVDSILLYDTESPQPIALFAGLHYACITDLAWAPDGSFLMASSTDGYCTGVAFEPGELGEPVAAADLPACVQDSLTYQAAIRHTRRLEEAAKKSAAAAAAKAASAAANMGKPSPVLPSPSAIVKSENLETSVDSNPTAKAESVEKSDKMLQHECEVSLGAVIAVTQVNQVGDSVESKEAQKQCANVVSASNPTSVRKEGARPAPRRIVPAAVPQQVGPSGLSSVGPSPSISARPSSELQSNPQMGLLPQHRHLSSTPAEEGIGPMQVDHGTSLVCSDPAQSGSRSPGCTAGMHAKTGSDKTLEAGTRSVPANARSTVDDAPTTAAKTSATEPSASNAAGLTSGGNVTSTEKPSSSHVPPVSQVPQARRVTPLPVGSTPGAGVMPRVQALCASSLSAVRPAAMPPRMTREDAAQVSRSQQEPTLSTVAVINQVTPTPGSALKRTRVEFEVQDLTDP